MAQIKLEEETRESDLTLLSHLDRKLGSLKQEQTDLIEASYDVKVRDWTHSMIFLLFSGIYFQASLTEQSEAQAFLTMQLINKIGVFSDSQRGDKFFRIV